jgi:dephospho-CoA kinase
VSRRGFKDKKGVVIGLTGPAGSGKTIAAAALARLGFEVFSLDAAGHAQLLEADVKKRLVSEFGSAILDAAGAVDRKKLGALVFSNRRALERLNEVVHPALAERARRWIEEVRKKNGAGVLEGALVYELGLDAALSGVVVLDAPFRTRLARLEKARGWDETRLRAVDAAQKPVKEKASRGAERVDGAGSIAALEKKLISVLKKNHWLPE